jgi:WD40 repeat protein
MSRTRVLAWAAVTAAGLVGGALSAPAPEEKDPRTPAEVEAAKDDLRRLQKLAEDPKADNDELWKAWRDFRVQHPGTPEWVRAAAVMAKAPSPLDKLDRDQIPEEDRLPWLPKEVVAVLGDQRGRHWGLLFSAAFSPDGRFVVGYDSDSVRLWDAATMRERAVLAARWPHFVAGGKRMIALGREDGLWHLWDLGGDEIKDQGAVKGMPEGETFAVLAAGGTTVFTQKRGERLVQAWDLSGDEPKARPGGKPKDRDWGTPVCASDDVLVDGDDDPKANLRVRDVRKDPPEIRCVLPAECVAPRAISPDGKLLASALSTSLRTVLVWDVSGAEPKILLTLEGHTDRVRSAAFSPDGSILATGGDDQALRLWPLDEAGRKALGLKDGQKHTAYFLKCPPNGLAFSADGKSLAVCAEDDIIHIWDIAKGEERFPPRGHAGAVAALAFSTHGKMLATGGGDHAILLWDLTGTKPRERAKLPVDPRFVLRLAFSPDGRKLLCAASGWNSKSQKQLAVIWDVTTEKPSEVVSWQPHDEVNDVAFAPDGMTVVTAGNQQVQNEYPRNSYGDVRWWDVSGGEPVQRGRLEYGKNPKEEAKWGREEKANWLAFSPRGDVLAVKTSDTYLRLYDWRKGDPVEREQSLPEQHGLHSVVFSPDGTTLATVGSWEGTFSALLWTVGRERVTVRTGYSSEKNWGRCWEPAFSPDGKRIASGCSGECSVREVPSGRVLHQWKLPDFMGRFACAPDGRHWACANVNGTAYIYRLESGPVKPGE